MRVLAVAGSSGGHIFPALALLDTLREKSRDLEAILVLPRKNICDDNTCGRYNIKYVSVRSFKRGLSFYNVVSLFYLVKGTLEGFFLVAFFKPDIVIGFGSITSIPLVFFAWMFRIKTLIHEQNVFPGEANRFLARFADLIAVSFDKTEEYLRDLGNKVILTGNPIRHQLKRLDKETALNFFGFAKDRFTILVMGGSQGSSSINRIFTDALAFFKESRKIQVIHLSGAGDEQFLKRRYEQLGVAAKIFPFFDRMQYAYSAADLAVSRSGAATVQELIYFCLPAVIIPYPFALKHQMANAAVLEEKGCVLIIDEKDADPHKIENILEKIMGDGKKLKSMVSNYSNFKRRDSSTLLCDEVLNIKSL